ncbi:hypothetical protein COO59_10205 [Mixta theicola]|uniref:Uncharacterized protein n=2 Tax=Mixta theicola TaxID=1458355 RepID=A0A2K1Q9Z6_9GAMM|nr:hypothetical protein COO59_10205 [Mixta theicola]
MRHLLIALILLSPAALAGGALVIQPQASGSLRILTEGLTGGADTLTFIQPPEKALTLQILPSAVGRCDGGDLAVESLRLSLLLDNHQRLACGEPVLFSAGTQSRQISVQLKSESQPQDYSALMRQGYGLRTQVGSVSFHPAGEGSTLYPLILDLSVLQEEVPILTAAFDSPTLQFGLVGVQSDTTAAVRLRIGKTRQAGDEVLPYTLSFESAQQQDSRYRLRSSLREQFIPYSISVGGREITPGSAWHGRIPAGIATSDVLNIEFTLVGRVTQGMAAGTRLLDTLTAVITPEI